MKLNKNNLFSNKQISHLLRSIAASYLLKNENRFKIVAYEKAADSVEGLTRELKDIWQERKLDEVEGIGPSIGSHLDEYFRTGRSKHFDSVLKKIPSGVFELMKIPTIGPKKAFKLVKMLHLERSKEVISDLKKASLAGKVAKLDTFGEKSQEDILSAIALHEKRSIKEERMPLPYAFEIAGDIIYYLKKLPAVQRADALGSLRRMVATIGDIDIAVQADEDKANLIVSHFVNYPKKISLNNRGEKKASIIVPPNVRVDLRVQDKKSYGSMLQYFTGSKSHNVKLREYALKKGYSLSEYGIKDLKNKKLKEFANEKNFYNFLGLQYIPPEIRKGTVEIDFAKQNTVARLVQLADIKGDLHIHSSYNLKPSHDLGNNSYREILEFGQKMAYEYVGFADHNPNISNNSTGEIVSIMKKRQEDIRRISKANYFIGLEVDILPTGKIALPQKAVDYVDYLIVSVHSSFAMSISQATKRVLTALSYPKVKILGHPTGRLLGKREGVNLDWIKVFEYCRARNIAVEINAWTERLDLPDTLVKEAIAAGVKLVIDSDAHGNQQMNNRPFAN